VRSRISLFAVCVAAAAVLQAADTWNVSGPMAHGRTGGGLAFSLPSGTVLVVGGMNTSTAADLSTELYDPATGHWWAGPPTLFAHPDAPAGIVLSDGRILVSGGRYGFDVRREAEIFNPNTYTWSSAGLMTVGRAGHTLSLLSDGRVLAAGGWNGNFLSSAEIFDPATATWTAAAGMSRGRWGHTATLLGDGSGRVFVVGGENYNDGSGPHYRLTEMWDPASGAWSAGPPLNVRRAWHRTAVLPDGRLMAIGGISSFSVGGTESSTEIFDGASWQYGPSMAARRVHFPLVTLHDGRLLVTGGTTEAAVLPQVATSGTERFDPATGIWSSAGSLNSPRRFHAAVQLADGRVLVAAGGDATMPLLTTEVLGASAPGDSTPPASTHSASAPNANGWNRFDVFVGLNATDEPGGAGVASITYTLSGAQSGGATASGSFTSFMITNEGSTTVTYFATDAAGNSEPPHSFTVALDKTPPVIAPVSNQTVSATSALGAVVTFNLSASDSISGVSTLVASPLSSGATFPHGTTNETITAIDAAGNTATRSFQVTVNRALMSVSVTPASATIDVGSGTSFEAIGRFTDGSSAVLPSGSGTGGNTFPSGGDWQFHFDDLLNTSACSPGHPGFSSQSVFVDASGAVNATWGGSPGILSVTGSITTQQVALTLSCASTGTTVGSIAAAWAGTAFSGTWTVGASTGGVTIRGWSSRGSMPTPRSALGAATVGGIVYAIGGTGSGGVTGAVEAYDPASNTWAQRTPMPTARTGAGVAELNGLIYVAGGRSAGGTPTGAVEIYDPADDTWTTAPPMTPRAHLALVAAGGRLYAIGGDAGAGGGGATTLVQRFDPATAQWTTMAPLANARASLVAGALNNGALLVAAGGAGTSTELYNVSTDTWSQGPAMLSPLSGSAAAVARNALYVFGATVSGGARITHMFRPATNQQPAGWAALARMPSPRGDAAAAAVGTDIYVTGGQAGGQAIAPAPLEVLSAPPPSDFAVNTGASNALPTPQWSSTNTSVAGITSGGFAQGMQAGQTTIVATANGISCAATATCATLTVVEPLCASVVLSISGNVPFTSIIASVNGSTNTFSLPLGVHTFSLRPGTYSVAFLPPPGYRASPNPATFTVACGDTAQVAVILSPIDTTPPALALPGDVTTDATSAAGAPVTYSASASDAVDGPTPMTCSPAAGSLFPIGTTSVECASSDAAGNTAVGTFSVRVLGPREVIAALADAIGDFGQGRRILAEALASLDRDNPSACNQLGAFVNMVQAQSGKSLAPDVAGALLARAEGVRRVLGCR